MKRCFRSAAAPRLASTSWQRHLLPQLPSHPYLSSIIKSSTQLQQQHRSLCMSAVRAQASPAPAPGPETEHAVISTFDLFSIGIGPSSSHTVGPMRAGKIFVSDLQKQGLLHQVKRIKIALYGSLAATGEGHHTPQALLLGLEGADCETVDTTQVQPRFEGIKKSGKLLLARDVEDGANARQVDFDYDKDLLWHWDKRLPLHSNGLRLSVFDDQGDLLAVNELYSIGGGFILNGALATANTPGGMRGSQESNVTDGIEVSTNHAHPVDLTENVYYKEINRESAESDRRFGSDPDAGATTPLLSSTNSEREQAESSSQSTESEEPKRPTVPYPFKNAASLLSLSKRHNLTIAQLVWENERTWYTPDEIHEKIFKIWHVMDQSIREGVHSTEEVLPGSLRLKRRAPRLYKQLLKGTYQGMVPPPAPVSAPASTSTGSKDQSGGSNMALFKPPPRQAYPIIRGDPSHIIPPIPPRRSSFAALDPLATYAISVNEQNAAGGRVVTAPTNGAAGTIPAVLKYHLEFQSDHPERDVETFLLTAAAVGMLVKRGATISAAEGACQAEVGVACAMAAAGLAAVMGAQPEIVAQAAEIALEHNLGLTCDPIDGLVQAPCIERNAMGAIKAVQAASLALAGDGQHAVTLDEVIEAMRQTARDMSTRYKETSRGGLSVTVRVPVAVPDC